MSRKSDSETKVPYEPHPWIADAVRSSDWLPNPDRPACYEFSNSKLVSILEGDPPYLRRDDLVWLSFRVHIVFGNESWWPVFIPVDVVRVDVIPGALRENQESRLGQVIEVAPIRRTLKAGGIYVVSEYLPRYFSITPALIWTIYRR